MTKTATWDRVVYRINGDDLGPEPLQRLARGDNAVIVLKGLLPRDDFASNRESIRAVFDRASTTRYVNGALTTIGPYLAKHLTQPEGYFRAAAEARALTAAASFDLAAQVRDRLRAVFGLGSLEPARERNGRPYAESVVRIHADGVSNPMHNDNIVRDAAGTGLRVAGIAHQLSCVVCIQECDSGGELEIHRRTWEPADEKFKIAGGLGYRDEVVGDAPRHVFKPQTGDVYLINPTYYHEVARVAGTARVTMGFFIGFDDDHFNDAVVWS